MISRLTMVFAVVAILLAFVLAMLHFTGGAPCGTGRHAMPGIEQEQTSVPAEPCELTSAERGLRVAEVTFWISLAGLVISGGVDFARRRRA